MNEDAKELLSAIEAFLFVMAWVLWSIFCFTAFAVFLVWFVRLWWGWLF